MPVQSDRSPIHQNGHVPLNPVSPALQAPLAEQDDLDLVRLLQISRRRGWIIFGVAATVTAVIWGWTLTRTPIYRGEFRVLIESVDDSDRSQQLLLDEQIQLSSNVDYDTQIEVLLSPVLLKPIAEALQDDYPNLDAGSLAANLSVTRLRETKVLAVSYRDPNPDKIQAILEEIARTYLEYSFEQHQASLQQGIQFVDDQLPELQERVTTLQIRLEQFRQEYSILDPESRGEDLSELLSTVEGQQQELQTQLTEARSLYSNLQSQMGYTPNEALTAAALSESSRYQALLDQIQELEAQIAVESARFQPDSPQIDALKERRDNLVPLLDEAAGQILGDRMASPADAQLTTTSLELNRQLINAANQVQMLEARRRALGQVEQNLKQEFDLVPGLARQYTDLQRELEIATESLNRFLATRETLQIDAAQKSVPWQLISEPSASQRPISPNVSRNLILGAIAGLLAGTAAALIVEKLNDAFHSPEELKTFTKLPILGVVPFLPELQSTVSSPSIDQLSPTSQSSSGLSGSHSSSSRKTDFRSSVFAESFRSLYANIRFLGADQPIQSLVVSSAIPSEGKSTVALHLAKAGAVMGQRVLLVDADLRSPKHHARLNLPNVRGLSNAISENMPLNQVIQRSNVDDNLFVLTAGPQPPDPVKLLSSKRIKTLMDQIKQHFDLIIYDTPPLLGFADSNLLATHTDGVVLVVGLGKTDRTALTRALDELKISSVAILGAVANGIKSHTTRSYGYYRYYQHYYSQSSSKPESGDHSSNGHSSNGYSSNSNGYSSNEHSSDDYSSPEPSLNGYSTRAIPATPDNGRPAPPPNPVRALASSSTLAVSSSRSHPVTTATVRTSPFSSRSLTWAIAGVSAALAFGIAGWMAYTRLLVSPPTRPVFSEEGDAVNRAEERAETTGAIAPATAPDSGTPSTTSPPPATVDEPFAEAVRIAEDAADQGERAATPEDWYVLAVQWKQASELMASVSPNDPRYETAQDRMTVYRQNSEYAYQRAEQPGN